MKKLTLLLTCVLSLTLAMYGCGDTADDTTAGAGGSGSTTTDAGGSSAGTTADAMGTAGTDTMTGSGDDAGTTGTGSPGTGTSGGACELIPMAGEGESFTTCDAATCECGVTITSVKGVVNDSDGNPLVGAKAQVCVRSASDDGTVCLPPVDTAGDGSFTLVVPGDNTCMRELVMRAIVANEPYSTAYCTLHSSELEAPGGVLELSEPVVLYATTPLLNPPPADYDQNAPYTAEFEGGLEIDVVASYYFNSALGVDPMAARWIPGTDHLCDASAIAGAPGVWAVSPEGDAFKTTFPARIPTDLADGTEVNVFVQGGIGLTYLDDAGEKHEIGEGAWMHFACATVSGGMITLEGDHGLPAISALTYVPVE